MITDGAEFIGNHLVHRLLNEGFDLVVVHNLSSASHENLSQRFGEVTFTLIEDAVQDETDVKKAFESVDVVFHLSVIVILNITMKNPILVNDMNVNRTLNVLKESLKEDINVFICTSFYGVYDEPISLPLTEEHPTEPKSQYAVSKLAAEHYCIFFHEVYWIETIYLRFCNVYGSKQTRNSHANVISPFLDKIRKSESPIIYGSREQTRIFVFIEDVFEASLYPISSKKCFDEVITVGSGIETPINLFTGFLVNLSDLHNIIVEYAHARDDDIRQSYADLTKAKRLRGYNPKIFLRSGLITLLIKLGVKC